MKNKIILKTILLAVLFFITVSLSYKYLSGLEDKSLVFVAVEDIGEHEIITSDMIKMLEIKAEEKDKFFPQAFESKTDIVGSVTRVKIKKNQVFLDDGTIIMDSETDDVIGDNGRVNNEYFTENDNRIAFISIDKNVALGGTVERGDYIDIIYTSQSDTTGGLYTCLLLQKLLVHKVSENPNSDVLVDVHFEVTPDEALLLTLAKYSGDIDFMLTNANKDLADVVPKLPMDLYAKLLSAGYVLVDENQGGQQAGTSPGQTGGTSPQSTSELEEEISQAEAQLAKALEALNIAKQALKAKESQDQSSQEGASIEEVVKSLEEAVRQLEASVNDNQKILEELQTEIEGGSND